MSLLISFLLAATVLPVPLIALIVLLVVAGIIVWLIPDAAMKQLAIKVVTVVVIVLLLVWVLGMFGLMPKG